MLSALAATILAAIAIIFMVRKSDTQSFVSVEDFWGGVLIGFLVGYTGTEFFETLTKIRPNGVRTEGIAGLVSLATTGGIQSAATQSEPRHSAPKRDAGGGTQDHGRTATQRDLGEDSIWRIRNVTVVVLEP
jgi:hypothetical protein